MPLYKPSELRAFLTEIDASPKKSLSQNFLIDGNIIRKITSFADIKPGDFILEIGSGPGVLTEALLAQGAHVTAIEKDRKFAAALSRLQTPDERLSIIEGDALKNDLTKVLKAKTKLVANLPYHITTPILTQFLPKNELFESITVMVQKEVATRFLAHAGSKDYGSITLLSIFMPNRCTDLRSSRPAYPPPKVKSAVVKFVLKQPPDVPADRFFTMTRLAFQQRRKMIRSTLKHSYSLEKIDGALLKIGKGTSVRPEDLTLADFLLLFKK